MAAFDAENDVVTSTGPDMFEIMFNQVVDPARRNQPGGFWWPSPQTPAPPPTPPTTAAGGQGLGMQGLPPAPQSGVGASGTNWAGIAQQYGPGIANLIMALARRNNGQGGAGTTPPEVQQMLAEHMRRMQATGPLYDRLTQQAMAGLPRTS